MVLLYIFSILISSVFCYDITFENSTSLTMAQNVSSQLVCNLNDTVYFIGGYTGKTTSNNIYYLDKKSNQWILSNTKLPGNGSYFSSNYICYRDTIYMFGIKSIDGGTGTGTGTIWIYNITINKIIIMYIPSNMDKIELPCTTIDEYNELIYIIGGNININNSNSISASNQLLVFNLNTYNIKQLSSMPYYITESMCNIINNTNINSTHIINSGVLLVFGGISYNNNNYKSILEYNISLNKWNEIRNHLNDSRSHTNSIYDSKQNYIFIIGGGNYNAEIFSINNYTDIIPNGSLPYNISYNSVSLYQDNKIVVWGARGYSKKNGSFSNLNQVWIYNLPDDDNSNTTVASVLIVISTCVGVLICGCGAYCMCARSSRPKQLLL